MHSYEMQPQSQPQSQQTNAFNYATNSNKQPQMSPQTNTKSLAVAQQKDFKGRHNYCDITQFLNMPQTQAAKLLGIPTSTLSKRGKESAPTRKWPWRTICKIDKELTSILKDVPPGGEIPRENIE